jgi:hydroxymethylpyrimidine/phosphomethylpyrimidine kinase
MKSVLTIAGSDCSGGAGIQADIKTLTMHKVFATSVITAVTAQNTCGVSRVEPLSPEMIESQLASVMEDIFPDAVKIGMIDRKETVDIIVKMLKKYAPKNIVVDTVMISSSGRRLMEESAMEAYTKKLLPMADVITPNIPESEVLAGIKIVDEESRKQAIQKLAEQYPAAVLMKGGHGRDNADDWLAVQGQIICYPGRRIANPNTHGTGCTLSSAIAANLALGYPVEESVGKAKEYITGAIAAGLKLGHGNGPLNHMWHG